MITMFGRVVVVAGVYGQVSVIQAQVIAVPPALAILRLRGPSAAPAWVVTVTLSEVLLSQTMLVMVTS